MALFWSAVAERSADTALGRRGARGGSVGWPDPHDGPRQFAYQSELARPEQPARFGTLRRDQHMAAQERIAQVALLDVACPLAAFEAEFERALLRRIPCRAAALE